MLFSVLIGVEETWKGSERKPKDQGPTLATQLSSEPWFSEPRPGLCPLTLPPERLCTMPLSIPLLAANPWHTGVSQNRTPVLIWDGVRITNSKVNHTKEKLKSDFKRVRSTQTTIYKINSKDPLYSVGDYIQYPVIRTMAECGKEYVHMYTCTTLLYIGN